MGVPMVEEKDSCPHFLSALITTESFSATLSIKLLISWSFSFSISV